MSVKTPIAKEVIFSRNTHRNAVIKNQFDTGYPSQDLRGK